MTDDEDKAAQSQAAHDRAQWGLLRALIARPDGVGLEALADRWNETAKTVRAETKEYDDECDTLEHCARELVDWLAHEVDLRAQELAAAEKEWQAELDALTETVDTLRSALEDARGSLRTVEDSAQEAADLANEAVSELDTALARR